MKTSNQSSACDKLIAQSNRLSAAVQFLSEYPEFEQRRLSAKIMADQAVLMRELEQATCDADAARMVLAFDRRCELLHKLLEDRLFYMELAFAAVKIYQFLNTEATLVMVEQYVQMLQTEY